MFLGSVGTVPRTYRDGASTRPGSRQPAIQFGEAKYKRRCGFCTGVDSFHGSAFERTVAGLPKSLNSENSAISIHTFTWSMPESFLQTVETLLSTPPAPQF